MSRRSTPERIYEAHRAGTLQRLIGEGELPDRAEVLIAAWERQAAQDGQERDGRWWGACWEWIAGKRDRVERQPTQSDRADIPSLTYGPERLDDATSRDESSGVAGRRDEGGPPSV